MRGCVIQGVRACPYTLCAGVDLSVPQEGRLVGRQGGREGGRQALGRGQPRTTYTLCCCACSASRRGKMHGALCWPTCTAQTLSHSASAFHPSQPASSDGPQRTQPQLGRPHAGQELGAGAPKEATERTTSPLHKRLGLLWEPARLPSAGRSSACRRHMDSALSAREGSAASSGSRASRLSRPARPCIGHHAR